MLTWPPLDSADPCSSCRLPAQPCSFRRLTTTARPTSTCDRAHFPSTSSIRMPLPHQVFSICQYEDFCASFSHCPLFHSSLEVSSFPFPSKMPLQSNLDLTALIGRRDMLFRGEFARKPTGGNFLVVDPEAPASTRGRKTSKVLVSSSGGSKRIVPALCRPTVEKDASPNSGPKPFSWSRVSFGAGLPGDSVPASFHPEPDQPGTAGATGMTGASGSAGATAGTANVPPDEVTVASWRATKAPSPSPIAPNSRSSMTALKTLK